MSLAPDKLKTRSLAAMVATGFAVILGLKLHFASVLDLYSDEIFYWLASTYPALAYSDLPFMTAQLAGLGNALAPGEALAVRSLFIILGSSIPLLVYWLARPLHGRRQAMEAAGLSLCVPLGGFLGLLAVPDVPLIVFGLLSIGFFQRAVAGNRWQHWLATGFFVALGLSTHYRFLLYPAAALLFLLAQAEARPLWRQPGLWLAMLIASIGLMPVIWFNLGNSLSSASFYFVERHPWEFQPSGLLHLFKQAGLVTPPLYGLLLYTAWYLWRQASSGNRDAGLFLGFAAINLLVYLLMAPWTDANSTSIHWPLSGYFPLLVWLPAALRQLLTDLAGRLAPRHLHLLLIFSISLGFLGTLSALAGVGSQAYQRPLQNLLGTGVLSNKMAGWQEFAAHTERLIANRFPQQAPVIITDNYYTAAQALFAGLGDQVYTLDQDKAVRDGRITQLQLWNMHRAGLAEVSGEAALYINEDSTLEIAEKRSLMDIMCSHATQMQYLEDLALFRGDKQFSYYEIAGLNMDIENRARPCPFPLRAWIDNPQPDSEVSGILTIQGWAFSEDTGVEKIELLLDGRVVQPLPYGDPRPDVVSAMNAGLDPNAPNLGFSATLDTTQFANGNYELAIDITNARKTVQRYGARSITIAN